jgi:hypothetical protein
MEKRITVYINLSKFEVCGNFNLIGFAWSQQDDELCPLNVTSAKEFIVVDGMANNDLFQVNPILNQYDVYLDQKEFALGVFLNVEGAFDNTSFESMDDAASDHGVCSTINRWIDFMLRSRSVFVDISRYECVTWLFTGGCTIALTQEYGGRYSIESVKELQLFCAGLCR